MSRTVGRYWFFQLAAPIRREFGDPELRKRHTVISLSTGQIEALRQTDSDGHRAIERQLPLFLPADPAIPVRVLYTGGTGTSVPNTMWCFLATEAAPAAPDTGGLAWPTPTDRDRSRRWG